MSRHEVANGTPNPAGVLFCDSDCPFCPPDLFGSDGGGGGGGDPDDGESSSSSSESSTSEEYSGTIYYATALDDTMPVTYDAMSELSSISSAESISWDVLFGIPTTTITSLTTTTLPPTTKTVVVTATPTPSADCELWDAVSAYEFEVYNIVGWATDGGDSLHTQEDGCGALTSWEWYDATDTSYAKAYFFLPIFLKDGCVERAIVSAGGPKIQCQGGGFAGKRRDLEARDQTAEIAVYQVPTEEQLEQMSSLYGPAPSVSPTYVPAEWPSTTASSTITSMA